MPTGSCLCGAVRYEITPPYDWMAHCHCSMCRKHTGALHDTGIGLPASGFRWISGEDAIVRHRSSPTANFVRSFCGCCGSPAASLPDDGQSVVVPAGSLEGDLELTPQAHIFVGSRSASCTITDGLPQFEKYPPQFDLPVVERPPAELKAGVVQGSCLCGDVAFEIEETPTRMVKRCRRGNASRSSSSESWPACHRHRE